MVESQASPLNYFGWTVREKEAWGGKNVWIRALVFQAQTMFLAVVILF